MDRPLLLVEDNSDDEALTLLALKKNGVDRPVLVARDGVEALDLLAKADPLPAVVLLDLKLPRIDGHEVLRRLRADERTRCLPVVVLTTSREPRDIQQACANGANSYVRKPVDFDRFGETLGLISRYWLTVNELPV